MLQNNGITLGQLLRAMGAIQVVFEDFVFSKQHLSPQCGITPRSPTAQQPDISLKALQG
jgi:hypothetical protein